MTDNPAALEHDPLRPHSLSPGELQELNRADRAAQPFLAYRDEQGTLELFATPISAEACTIGRRGENDLALPWDGEVSGLHAELQLLGGELTIVDDGLSTNGTFVNGQRVNGRQRLRDGDRIRVGQTILAYRTGENADAMKTAAGQSGSVLLTDSQRRVLVALCRPCHEGTRIATPATNQQIASELFLSVDAVKMHLRALFAKFELADLPQNRKRAQLADCALQLGLVTRRDLQ